MMSMIIIGLFAFEAFADWHDDSMKIYYHYSNRFIEGSIPYRDYDAEYPPLAILAFGFPHFLAIGQKLTLEEYSYRYLFVNVGYCFLISIVILRLVQRQQYSHNAKVKIFAILMIAVVVTSLILPWRSDLFPAFLTILSLYFLVADRPLWAGFFIGLAVLAKIYPVFLIPIFGFYLIINNKIPDLKRFIVGGLGSILLLVPLFILAPNWISHFLSYHQERGLEIESMFGGLILFLQMLGIGTTKTVFNFGAYHLISGYATIIIKWLPYITVAAFAVVFSACFFHFKNIRTKLDKVPLESLAAYCVATLLVFMSTNKVFSPQYIIWLVPFVPLLKIRYASLMVVIFSLTLILFPFGFLMLLDYQPLSIILLNIRNNFVVVLAIWLLVDYTPLARNVSTAQATQN